MIVSAILGALIWAVDVLAGDWSPSMPGRPMSQRTTSGVCERNFSRAFEQVGAVSLRRTLRAYEVSLPSRSLRGPPCSSCACRGRLGPQQARLAKANARPRTEARGRGRWRSECKCWSNP